MYDANNMQNFLCSEQELHFIIYFNSFIFCPKLTMNIKRKTNVLSSLMTASGLCAMPLFFHSL